MPSHHTPLHHTVSGTGQPVVLIHAGVADSRMWAAQAGDGPAGLADRFTLVAPDLRGFGDSPMPAPEDAPWSNAGDVLAVMDHLGIATSRATRPPVSRTRGLIAQRALTGH